MRIKITDQPALEPSLVNPGEAHADRGSAKRLSERASETGALPTEVSRAITPFWRAVSGFKETNNLSRRRHQDGQLLKLRHGWAVRFYEDYVTANGERCRRRVQKWLGHFKNVPTERTAKNEMYKHLALVNDFALQPRTTLTFRTAASRWISDCEKRKRKPIKPSVIHGWKNILEKHVLPVLGDMSLSDVDSQAMKDLVNRLVEKKLSPSTIKNIMLVVKLTVASVIDDRGNQLYPVTWNSKIIDAPEVDETKQSKPSFTGKEVTEIVNAAAGRLQMAVILLAASGIRAGELLGLECRNFDGQSIRIEQEVWREKILEPKTPYAKRFVDLHPQIAGLLQQFIGQRKSGFLFQTLSGRSMNQRNLARDLYSILERLAITKRGFHAFRRFRNTYLRQSLCPTGLLKYWMGHSTKQDMSDRYDRSCEDLDFRRDVARSLAVGFELPQTLTIKRPRAGKENLSGVIGRQDQKEEMKKSVSTCV